MTNGGNGGVKAYIVGRKKGNLKKKKKTMKKGVKKYVIGQRDSCRDGVLPPPPKNRSASHCIRIYLLACERIDVHGKKNGRMEERKEGSCHLSSIVHTCTTISFRPGTFSLFLKQRNKEGRGGTRKGEGKNNSSCCGAFTYNWIDRVGGRGRDSLGLVVSSASCVGVRLSNEESVRPAKVWSLHRL